jgi:hypothetical protein
VIGAARIHDSPDLDQAALVEGSGSLSLGPASNSAQRGTRGKKNRVSPLTVLRAGAPPHRVGTGFSLE